MFSTSGMVPRLRLLLPDENLLEVVILLPENLLALPDAVPVASLELPEDENLLPEEVPAPEAPYAVDGTPNDPDVSLEFDPDPDEKLELEVPKEN